MTPAEASAQGIPLAVEMNGQVRLAIAIVRLGDGRLAFADWGWVEDDYTGHPLHLLPTMRGDAPEWIGDGAKVFVVPDALRTVYGVDRMEDLKKKMPAMFGIGNIQAAAEAAFR